MNQASSSDRDKQAAKHIQLSPHPYSLKGLATPAVGRAAIVVAGDAAAAVELFHRLPALPRQITKVFGLLIFLVPVEMDTGARAPTRERRGKEGAPGNFGG